MTGLFSLRWRDPRNGFECTTDYEYTGYGNQKGFSRHGWILHVIIEPAESYPFLVLKLQDEDGIIMQIVDAHNQPFFPNTSTVRNLMKSRQKAQEILQDNSPLQDSWLALFDDEED